MADALAELGPTLWVRTETLHAVGLWSDSGQEVEPAMMAALEDAPRRHARAVVRGGAPVGALSVERPRTQLLSSERTGC
ncbi:hypothetical protein GTR02_09705 [Kineococcus sp. R8]|uniref:hypothetical protein n=1 Tax=Kineococcus siccus TaxID=2696567 RepID=UPI0014125374|nr:hypothetical protein [Kineococcus siccus]NAZ82091.1 hypothetical protein [Kineococcus siccus]